MTDSRRSQDEGTQPVFLSPSTAQLTASVNQDFSQGFAPPPAYVSGAGGFLRIDQPSDFSAYPDDFDVAPPFASQVGVGGEVYGTVPWLHSYSPPFDIPSGSFEPQDQLVQHRVPEYLGRSHPPNAPGAAVPSIQIPDSSVRDEASSTTTPLTPSSAAALGPPPLPPSSKHRGVSASNFSDSESALREQPRKHPSGNSRTAPPRRMSRQSPSSPVESSASFERIHEDQSRRRSTSTGVGRPRSRSKNAPSRAAPQGQTASVPARLGPHVPPNHPAPSILPAEKVFPIQIGSELFRLSGASIASDGLYLRTFDLTFSFAKNLRAPSYFSQFFEDQIKQNEESGGVRTLYIDRDPVTFRDISQHLQGYHIKPRDGSHFVKLFADAQFYSLPRLISQLFESEIFIQIGDQHFQIPRDIFSGPGDSPNFFSLGFAVFFSTPSEVFPGLDRRGLLRPPSILPPSVPTRSASVFAQLLHMLRGYPLHIESDEHRAELLRDCRYFHLRGLEQKLIAHSISYNLSRQKSEIAIHLSNIRQSGISFVRDPGTDPHKASPGWIHYSRPFVDETAYELILEISASESSVLDIVTHRLDFHGQTKARITSLLQVAANKMNLPTQVPLGLMMMKTGGTGASAQPPSPGYTPLSEERVKAQIDADADVLLDGQALGREDLANLGLTNNSYHTSGDENANNSEIEPESARPGATFASQAQLHPSAAVHHSPHQPPPRKRKRTSTQSALADDQPSEWVLRKAQWRLRVQRNLHPPNSGVGGGLEVVFVAVKIDAVTGEKGRNRARGFLS